MKRKWVVDIDRDDEVSITKGGLYSIMDTAEMIAYEYHKSPEKPEAVEVICVGIGHGLADALAKLKLPVKRIECCLSRVGCADVYKVRSLD